MNRLILRRDFLGVLGTLLGSAAWGASQRRRRLLLRSSWQAINIGDIAHTPGMLRLLEQHLPEIDVTLWPSSLTHGVEALLRKRFPRLSLAQTAAEKTAALEQCGFCLHGSGPGMVGWRELERWRKTGKPYGFGGITLNDAEIKDHRDLLAGARFVFCRDTDSLRALQASRVQGPDMAFGPDATFALDLRDERRADEFLRKHELETGRFICAVPRLRWTPYWKQGRKYAPGEIERREKENEQYREADHAKLREALIAWVRETKNKVLLCPEMTYQVDLLRSQLFDPLPQEVKANVVVRGEYWLPDEAASTYARAFAVLSLEMHSPIIAFASGTPAIHLRQPTDTRKGQMWRDIGLGDWLFEIDQTAGKQIADRLLGMYRNPAETRKILAKAQDYVQTRCRAMMNAVAKGLGPPSSKKS